GAIGRSNVADGRAAACDRDAEAGECEATAPRRLHLRYGAEHGGLVPAEGVGASRCAGKAAPCRDAEFRWFALCRQPAHVARGVRLYIEGRGCRDVGAALYLSWISLCRDDRLSGRARPWCAGRPRSA